MALADYAHWNEEAEQVWWQEEGRHADADRENYEWDNEELNAEQAFSEDIAELDTEDLRRMLADDDYISRWPKSKRLILWELKHRGE